MSAARACVMPEMLWRWMLWPLWMRYLKPKPLFLVPESGRHTTTRRLGLALAAVLPKRWLWLHRGRQIDTDQG